MESINNERDFYMITESFLHGGPEEQRQAGEALETRYGAYLRAVAGNLVGAEQADACACAAYDGLRARGEPLLLLSRDAFEEALYAFLGGEARHAALEAYFRSHNRLLCANACGLLTELDACMPAAFDTAQPDAAQMITDWTQEWLRTLFSYERRLFLRRYYYGDPLERLASERRESAAHTKKELSKLREQLKRHLAKRWQDKGQAVKGNAHEK